MRSSNVQLQNMYLIQIKTLFNLTLCLQFLSSKRAYSCSVPAEEWQGTKEGSGPLSGVRDWRRPCLQSSEFLFYFKHLQQTLTSAVCALEMWPVYLPIWFWINLREMLKSMQAPKFVFGGWWSWAAFKIFKCYCPELLGWAALEVPMKAKIVFV